MENIEIKKFQLEQDEGTIVGEDNLKVYITEYYKKNCLVILSIMVSSWWKTKWRIYHSYLMRKMLSS
jgi:hypothetical protein